MSESSTAFAEDKRRVQGVISPWHHDKPVCAFVTSATPRHREGDAIVFQFPKHTLTVPAAQLGA